MKRVGVCLLEMESRTKNHVFFVSAMQIAARHLQSFPVLIFIVALCE